MVRYMRTVGIFTLALCVILGPVAPAFAQAAQAQQQQQTPPPTTPPPTPPQAPPTNAEQAQQPPPQAQAPPAQVPQPATPSTADHVDDKTPREYSHGVPWFPSVLGPYSPMHIGMPNLANGATLQQYMRDGKLYLTVQDAIALALQNDLDIAVARYNPLIAETNVLSARSGLGTAFSFDPRFNVTGGINHSNTPVGNPFLTGAGTGATSFTQTVDSLQSELHTVFSDWHQHIHRGNEFAHHFHFRQPVQSSRSVSNDSSNNPVIAQRIRLLE